MEQKETKTITMPYSEYRRMEEIVANYYASAQEKWESYGEGAKECENRIETLLGCKIDEIIYYKQKYKIRESIFEHIMSLKEELDMTSEERDILTNKVSILEDKLSKYESKKWWQFWK